MARLRTLGFELNSLTVGHELDAVSGSPTIASDIKRSGDYALKIGITGGESRYVQVQLGNTDPRGPYYVRFYVYITKMPTGTHTIFNMQMIESPFTQHVKIDMDAAGRLILKQNNTQIGLPSGPLQDRRWYRIEVKFDSQGGTGASIISARIDGTEFAQDGTLSIPTGISFATFGANLDGFTNTTEIYFDDIAINDGLGTEQADFPGGGRIVVLRPNALDQNEGWSRGGADSGDDHGQIDETAPNDATDYLIAGTVDQTTETFNPSTGAVDGTVINDEGAGGASWDTLRLRQTGSSTSLTTINPLLRGIGTGVNAWREMRRGIVQFDTSSLPDDAIIGSAKLRLYAVSKQDTHSMSIGVSDGEPASLTALATSDYSHLKYGLNQYATAIAIASIATSAYNEWVLNTIGIEKIKKDGVTKFGIRTTHDIVNAEPAKAIGYSEVVFQDNSQTNRPELVVVYEMPAHADFQVTNPYDYGLTEADTISLVEAQARARTATENTSVMTCQSKETSGYSYSGSGLNSFNDFDNVALAEDDVSEVWPDLAATATSNKYEYLIRGLLRFDTSVLPDNARITFAVIQMYAQRKSDTLSQSIAIVKADTSSVTTDLSDWDKLTNQRVVSDVAISAITVGAYNDFTLNALGKSLISLNEITRFFVTFASDVDNVAPTWVSGARSDVNFGSEVYTNSPKLYVEFADSATLGLGVSLGSGIEPEEAAVDLDDTTWVTGDREGWGAAPLSIAHQPDLPAAWNMDVLTGLRLTMRPLDNSPVIHVSTAWVNLEYRSFEEQTSYSVTIDGVDRTADVINKTLVINDELNDKVNTCNFRLQDLSGDGAPVGDDEIIITVNGVRYFGGLVARVTMAQLGPSELVYDVECVDYTRLLDRRLVATSYQDMTAKEIIESIVEEFAEGEGITTHNVSEGPEIASISFNYVQISQALRQIAEATGRHWFIDYNKDIHYTPVQQNRAPFIIDSTSNEQQRLKLLKDNSTIKNRVFVRGGLERSDTPIVEEVVADGDQRQFLLAEKPHDLVVKQGGVVKTLGIKFIDDAGAFDYLVNFQEKYVECGTNTTTPTNGTVMTFEYQYDFPILVSVEDNDSIVESGLHEFVIIDNQISSTQEARDRAGAELTDFADQLIEATYDTEFAGIRSGQYQRITLTEQNVDDDYIIKSVRSRSLGGGKFVFSVQLTSSKSMGIIKFLIELLEVSRSVGVFNRDERVDQLFTLSDSLDSLVDALSIDSAGYGFPWAQDSGAPASSLKWDLGQWT